MHSDPPRPKSSEPVLLAGAAALAAGLLATETARAAGGRLLVYLHVAVKQRALQSILQAGLPDVTTTTVGRIGDFERVLQQGQDAVLTLPAVLSAQGLAPGLQGRRRGESEEVYSLVGNGSTPDAKRVEHVGALDLLGRSGTDAFVRHLTNSRVRVERVTKVEDLLPLMQLQRVEAVLLPSRLFAELRSTSRLPLVQRDLEAKVGLPAAASVGPAGAQVLSAIGKLPRDASQMLGVDEWR